MTTLLIITHNITGLKYFCKTTAQGSRFNRYKGSGKYWKRHLKVHGDNVSKTILAQFDETNNIQKLLLEGTALEFSELNDIADSKEWANLKPENGLDGGTQKGHLQGVPKSHNHKLKISKGNTGKTRSDAIKEVYRNIALNRPSKSAETIEKHRISSLGVKHSQETKNKISKGNKGKVVSDSTKQKISHTRIINEVGKGSNNPNALKINIYNQNNELMFKCNGNIKEIIKENKLPYCLLDSYRNNGRLIYLKRKNSPYHRWYSKIIEG